MASNIKISITNNSNCKSFIVTEKTSAYNATFNPGGYGIPNIALGNILSSKIQVSLYNSDVIYTINTSATLPSNSNAFVTINNTDIGFLSNQVITDGIYLVDYILTGQAIITNKDNGTKALSFAVDLTGIFSSGDIVKINTVNYTVDSINTTILYLKENISSINIGDIVPFTLETSKYTGFNCIITNCYLDSLNKIDVTGCDDCNKEALALSIKIDTILQSAKYAANCGKPNRATQLFAYLTNLCNEKNCTTCK